MIELLVEDDLRDIAQDVLWLRHILSSGLTGYNNMTSEKLFNELVGG